MRTIPQRELRNKSGEVLREAESGEQFVITVNGRPVATLGPYKKRVWVDREEVEKVLASATDDEWLRDIKAFEGGMPRDPWERR